MAIVEVGIRELRADLSNWVRRVRGGDEVVVTDRGKPVARLLAVEGERTLDRLIREGRVIPARRRKSGDLPPLVEGIEPLSDIVLRDRR
jgi:prevent-host-death family protein